VDRLGRDANAILDAARAAELGRYLARSPHVIRIHDVGRLMPDDVTYHVLQLVDGDTLDHLAEISGREHASVSRPEAPRASHEQVRREYLEAVEGSASQGWRRRRPARPFTHELSVSMALDILTSVMLWLEEVHDLGYAINDLKNGNLMISRRGQLKGIDLDSYSPIRSTADRAPDFYFLSVSALMMMLSSGDRECTSATCDVFQVNAETLRADILECWPFGNVGRESQGRVETEEVVIFLVDLVRRCRNRDYAREPDAFRADVDRLIRLKRSIQLQEIVLD
jgi:serine/threonine protein kinase